MAQPAIGNDAPAFALKDQHGKSVSLASLRGEWAVLYFYPKDGTPGCTKEACDFRDNHGPIQALGASVIGVSADSALSHQKFAEKYDLPFTLLVDDDNHSVARAYGAFGMKKNYGREYEGIIRSTVIIDPDGKVAKTWASVKPDAHGRQVLEWLKANVRR